MFAAAFIHESGIMGSRSPRMSSTGTRIMDSVVQMSCLMADPRVRKIRGAPDFR